MSTAVIGVQNVGFAVLYNRSRLIDGESSHQIRLGDRPAVDPCDHWFSCDLADLDPHSESVSHGGGAVIDDIEVQVSVAIYISQRHRHAAGFRAQPGLLGCLVKMASAIVEKAARAAANRIDQQVQVAVAVNIREYGASRGLAFTSDAGSGRDILELPFAEIAEEPVVSFDRAKIEIAQPVAVDVSGRHAGAIEENVVRQGMFFGKVIGEVNA